MLAVVPVLADAVAELAYTVGTTGADGLGDRLERALDEDVKLLALTVDERAILLAALEDTPEGLAELRPCSSTRRVAAAGIELECLLASLTVLLDDGKPSTSSTTRSNSGYTWPRLTMKCVGKRRSASCWSIVTVIRSMQLSSAHSHTKSARSPSVIWNF
jgi:hypothetical protein